MRQIMPIGPRKRPRLGCASWSGSVNSTTGTAKVNLFPDFREFLKSLNSMKIKYLLIDGYAVNYYGYRRTTNDLDVWIAVDPALVTNGRPFRMCCLGKL